MWAQGQKARRRSNTNKRKGARGREGPGRATDIYANENAGGRGGCLGAQCGCGRSRGEGKPGRTMSSTVIGFRGRPTLYNNRFGPSSVGILWVLCGRRARFLLLYEKISCARSSYKFTV